MDEESEGDEHANVETETSQRVRLAIGGDSGAQNWVITRFSPYLLAQARYRLKGPLHGHLEAEDLVALTWETGLRKLEALEARDGKLSTSLMKLLSAIQLRKYQGLLQKYIIGKPLHLHAPASAGDGKDFELSAGVSGAVTKAVRKEDGVRLLDCLDELPEADREILVLRVFEQMTNTEAADALEISAGAAAARFLRAKERLGNVARHAGLSELMAD